MAGCNGFNFINDIMHDLMYYCEIFQDLKMIRECVKDESRLGTGDISIQYRYNLIHDKNETISI